jgi:glycosyltransferase involved in cell wall biosynthesis
MPRTVSRVRVLLLGANSLSPECGGGYTLSQDILRTLLKRSVDCAHRFIVLDSGATAASEAAWPAHVTRIRDARPLSRRIPERMMHEVRRGLGGLSRRPRPEHPYFQGVREELRRHRVDCALGLTPLAWSTDLPNIVTVWDLEHRRKPYFPEVTTDGEWEARERNYHGALSKAIAVITGTETGKRQIAHFYGVDPDVVKVIPFPTPSFVNSVGNTPDTRFSAAAEAGTYVLYPAQYWPHKNHVRLFQAIKLLRDRSGWEVPLICCGADQRNLAFLRRRTVELGIADQVRFVGFVTPAELVTLYRGALALAFVSYFGPDNLPPLEACALGCPVIASNVEGAKDALESAALYVNPDRADEVAEAIWRIKHEPGLRDRLVAAGKLRSTGWTVDDYADELFRLLDALEVKFECFRE